MALLRSNEIIIPVASFFYAIGWFSLAFVFPIIAVSLNYGYELTGFLGVFIGLPYALVSFSIKDGNIARIRKIVIFSEAIMLPVTVMLIFFYKSLFFPLLIVSDFATGTYWIASEIFIGQIGKDMLAERYSTAWGIPNLVAPLMAGVILEFTGYGELFVIIAVFFLLAVFFNPRKESENTSTKNESKPLYMMFLPLFLIGLSSGYFYYVIIPFLKISGIQIYLIGLVATIPPMVTAITFIAMNYIHSRNWIHYVTVSSSLLAFPLLLSVNHSLLFIVLVTIPSSAGVAIAFSKLLAYISTKSSPGTGVFYYESMFGAGFMAGSFTGGILFSIMGFTSAFIIFLPALVFAFLTVVSRKIVNTHRRN